MADDDKETIFSANIFPNIIFFYELWKTYSKKILKHFQKVIYPTEWSEKCTFF